MRYPWQAAVQRGSPRPARFYASVIGQALRYGLPASRRPGAVWALVGRAGVPEAALTAAIRRLPGRPRPDLDALVAETRSKWRELADRARALPAAPPELSVLALQRAAALTVFLFGDDPRPLLVLKLPAPGDPRVDLEVVALEAAEPAGISPRFLGQVGKARVQEGLTGAPLRVGPLTPERAADLAWSQGMTDVAEGVARLGAATAEGRPQQEIVPQMELALAYDGLDSRTRRLLTSAWADVRRSGSSVLRHRDTSPQNCLVSAGRLTGIVDWELAVPRGGPGFDVWNLGLSAMEYGLGLTRWSQELVTETFARAWEASPFWREARAAARRAAIAGGAPERDLDALELCFFGSRIGDRLEFPGRHPTLPGTAARNLEVVCRS
ncbi:hypothetical protein BH20ACT19_BH20ACT19_13440 [soil metagenome]